MLYVRPSYVLLVIVLVVTTGCMSAGEHRAELGSTQERETTLGVVQKNIQNGMSQADVAEALGSPNIVTKDSSGDETWIYDKIASEVSYSRSSGGTGIIVALIAGFNREAGAASSTQRTLTVVIKFDESGRVKNTSYHASKF